MAEFAPTSIDAVLARFLDGEPEPRDGERLASAMREDPRFAQEVVRLLTVDDLLRQSAVPDDHAFLESLKLRLDEGQGGGEFAEAFERRLRASQLPGSRWGSRRRWAGAIAACVLTLLLGGLVLRALKPRSPEHTGRPTVERGPGPLATSGRGVSPESGLAMVVKLEGVLWEPREGPHPSEGELLAGGRLRFRAGRLTLSMLTGVALVVEGPADFELVAPDRVFCRRGRLRARVPKGAEGFVIATRASAVVDLGTEFAVNVEADGRAQVMVFEGLAEVALLDAEGSPTRTQLVAQSKSFDLDPGGDRIAESVARPEGFVSGFENAVPTLVLTPGYASAVMNSRPKGYWRFESLSGGLVSNEVAGGPPLRAFGPIGVVGARQGNGCARFETGVPDQFLGTDALWEVAQGADLAVEFWFMADDFSHASLVGFLPPGDLVVPGQVSRYVHSFLVEVTARQRQSLNKPASVRFLSRWPLDATIGNNLFSADVYVPRRWHHVVAQKNGDHMELFFDGESCRLVPAMAEPPTLACRLVVGRRTTDTLDPSDIRPFVGRLDELAIYDHRLSADEVRLHFQLAAQKVFAP